MSALIDDMRKKALALRPEDRVRLAEALMASVEKFAGPEIEGAWREEVRSRVAEIESGRATLVSSDLVHRKARCVIDEVRRLSRRG